MSHSATLSFEYIASINNSGCMHQLLENDWAMLLDSGTLKLSERNSSAADYKRFDILVFQPSAKISFTDKRLEVTKGKQTEVFETSSPLLELRKILAAYQQKYVAVEGHQDIPFCGGLLGYLSYDLGKQFLSDKSPIAVSHPLAKDDLNIPYLRMGIYQWALITDHKKQTTRLYNFGLSEQKWLAIATQIKSAIKSHKQNQPQRLASQVSQFKSNRSFAQYAAAFEKIQNYIKAGDCYQINYAQRFSAKFVGSPVTIYQQLAKANNSPFSGYLHFDDFQILCLSPERFIAVKDRQVITQPIKGTLPRKADPEEDIAQAERLINSEKDRAENLMIVDLLRNDLSRTAVQKSVEVTELFGHYRFESVHHLISTVESRLAPQFDLFDLLQTTLPGGSITGAPKIRAMQIIDELEPSKRGIYCGIIGYIDFAGSMDSNICIRTLVAKQGMLYCWAGGGLVADSNLQAEYQETFDKLNKILPILNAQQPTSTASPVTEITTYE